MEPIVLTEFGETLRPYSGFDKCGTTDRTVLISSCWGERVYDKDVVGVHDVCNGTIQLKKVSTTHNALCCNNCSLRVVVPKEIDNYGKLRLWCALEIEGDKTAEKLEILWRERGREEQIPETEEESIGGPKRFVLGALSHEDMHWHQT